MAEEIEDDDDAPKKKKGMLVPLLIGVVLALAGGAGGFWAVTMGPLAPEPEPVALLDEDDPHAPEPMTEPIDVSFIPLETLIISLGPDESSQHLIFTAELEIDPSHEEDVTRLVPRVLDVLNSYLRVISLSELSDPSSLARLRAQMLRRIQIVTGAGRVHDLLVTQFVVN